MVGTSLLDTCLSLEPGPKPGIFGALPKVFESEILFGASGGIFQMKISRSKNNFAMAEKFV